MAEVAAISAKGAVDSLLGHISAVLVSEAQLLGRVRGDMQFIKDEMEMMNDLLMLLSTQHRHHLPWMKQATELARDTQDCIDQYVQCVAAGALPKGILGRLRQVSRLVLRLSVRHRLATQIQDIKVRICQVNDRRQAYDIAPITDPYGRIMRDIDIVFTDSRDAWSFSPSFDEPQADLKMSTVNELIGWLMEDQSAGLRIIPVTAVCVEASKVIAERVYKNSSITGLFDCQAWINVHGAESHVDILKDILSQVVLPLNKFKSDMDGCWNKEQLVEKIHCYLQGKIFLVVLHDVRDESIWSHIKLAFPDDCSARSAIIITPNNDEVTESFSLYKIFNPDTSGYVLTFFLERAIPLLKHQREDTLWPSVPCMLIHLEPQIFFMKMFLRYLYYKGSCYWLRVEEEHHGGLLHDYWPRKMVELCFYDLPVKCQNCMLYLSIFPPGCSIRRTSLVRRWVVEGLITDRQESSALEQADRCFDALVGRLLLCPSDIDASGKVKTCTVRDLVHDVIIDLVARGSGTTLVGTILAPKELVRHLSIRFSMKLHMSPSEPIDNVLTFLKSLPSSSLLGLLKVLDLDGCRGLKRHHLKNICGIYLLKYLSLRDTDVTRLPREIENLIHLETLDIRQTKINTFPRKSLVLPMLKHLFSGYTVCPSEDIIRQQESFSAIHIPHRIGRMRNMEILSHVEVSHGGMELIDVGQLLKLRKLGVVIHDTDKDGFDRLLHVISRLHKCLRSLSIRIRLYSPDDGSRGFDMSMMDATLPRLLESLRISGIRSGLPQWIEHLHQLTKVTLRDTSLTESDIHVLGKLVGLRYLRLRHRSYIPGNLTISGREFKNLQLLLIENSDIVSIRFDERAAPRLERLVWRFTIMDSLVGIDHLLSFRELQLHGDCDTEKIGVILHDIKAHSNDPSLKHIPAAGN
ncbi:disease resistance protein PIK6-NP-like [Oryza glaberrima]|uniref:disease resistance protein PIK6-NP-like n=1 Tax=Oryza glaberrima TaxID=4538 RepID=UPI00224BEF88|nr:disease resistance protein PIK6-NP-like [Oryza glaberrima]